MTAPRFQLWELLGGTPAFIFPEAATLPEACRRLPSDPPAVIARGGVIVREGDGVTASRRAKFADTIARRWMRFAPSSRPKCARAECPSPVAAAPAGCPDAALPFCWQCRRALLAGAASGANINDLAAMQCAAPRAKGSPVGVSTRGRTQRETALLAACMVADAERVAHLGDIAREATNMGLDVLAVQGRVSDIANLPLRWLELHAVNAYRITRAGIIARAAIVKRDAKLAQGVTT